MKYFKSLKMAQSHAKKNNHGVYKMKRGNYYVGTYKQVFKQMKKVK